MKLALIQLDPTVGDLEGNARNLLDAATRAERAGAELSIASELCLVGYPPRDLLEHGSFLEAIERATKDVIARSPAVPLLFGTVGQKGRHLRNQAVVAQSGVELGRATKQLLPNYDVFDEQRYFTAGSELFVPTLAGKRCAITICEDAWANSSENLGLYPHDPLSQLAARGAELLINLSASPFTLPKRQVRDRLFRDIAKTHQLPVAMVNQVGANDELIFDGSSTLYDAEGNVLGRARAFEEDLVITSLHERAEDLPAPIEQDAEAAYRALVLGIRDYARKCGFQTAVLGLSGGIDSALVATLARDALGPDRVLAVSLPARYSSAGSVNDARELATRLGIAFRVISIDSILEAYLEQLGPHLDALRPAWPEDVTWENVQARIRGATVMAISNRTGALPLTTGNKSELAVGYCTLYGDMVGGLNPLSDVPKTMVYQIARWCNQAETRIPDSILEKPPSAELKPDQRDQDSLPPYDVLDAILEQLIEQHRSIDQIVARGFSRDVVTRVSGLVLRAEYKRRQAAPGLIITRKAFGLGRRVPIAQGFRERVR